MNTTKHEPVMLTDFFGKSQSSKQFQLLSQLMDLNGFVEVVVENYPAKVYNTELALILTSSRLHGVSQVNSKKQVVNGINFADSYVLGYKRGIQFFDTEFKVSPDVLYGHNTKQYVLDIRENYFHREHKPDFKGWVQVKRTFPIALTHEGIEELGYYAGIVASVEMQVKKYPTLFDSFKLNRSQIIDSKKSTTSPKITGPVTKRFCELANDSKLMERGIDESSQRFCKRVCERFNLKYQERATRRFAMNETPRKSDKHLQRVVTLILPSLQSDERLIIEKFIGKHFPLYA